MNEYVRVYRLLYIDDKPRFACVGLFRRETILRVSTNPHYKDGRFYAVTLAEQAAADFSGDPEFYVRSLADLGIETPANASDKRAA